MFDLLLVRGEVWLTECCSNTIGWPDYWIKASVFYFELFDTLLLLPQVRLGLRNDLGGLLLMIWRFLMKVSLHGQIDGVT